MMDKNKDNSLTIDEMGMLKNLVPRLRDDPERLNTVFKTLDTNDDGKLSRDEMKSIRNLSGG
jgi:Ca2+-binding EF-hand superfamily protein